MIRLIIIIIVMVLIPANHVLCDVVHPCDVETWDIMKHEIYMIWGALLACMSLFKPVEKYEPLVMAITYGIILGLIIPCMIDTYGKDRHVHWWDFAFWILGLYAGLSRFVPVVHKRIALFFINDKTYNYICRLMK